MPIEQQVTWKPTKVGDRLVGTMTTSDEVDTVYGRKTVTEWHDVTECRSNGHDIDVQTVTYWPSPAAADAIHSARIRPGVRGGLLLKEVKGRTLVFGSVNLDKRPTVDPDDI